MYHLVHTKHQVFFRPYTVKTPRIPHTTPQPRKGTVTTPNAATFTIGSNLGELEEDQPK